MKLTRTLVKVDFATAAAQPLKAAAAATTHRVVSFFLVAAGTVTVKFQSGSTDLTGAMTMAAGTPLVDRGVEGLITAANAALNLTLGGAVQVSGYVIVESETTSD